MSLVRCGQLVDQVLQLAGIDRDPGGEEGQGNAIAGNTQALCLPRRRRPGGSAASDAHHQAGAVDPRQARWTGRRRDRDGRGPNLLRFAP